MCLLGIGLNGPIRSDDVQLELIGNVPPAEFEMRYYQQQEESAMAA
jgi:hypothetical protein